MASSALGAAGGGWLALAVGGGPACAIALLPGVCYAVLVLARPDGPRVEAHTNAAAA